MKMKQIMSIAWKIAKRGAKKFGGNASEYIAEAMKMAWAMYKKEIARKGGDIVGLAAWFIRKEFGHESMVKQIQESPLFIKKQTEKANLVEMHIVHNGQVIDTNTFWAPKSVCF